MGRQRLRARGTGPREAGARRAQERGQAGAGLGGPRGALPSYLRGAAPGWPASPFPSSARSSSQPPGLPGAFLLSKMSPTAPPQSPGADTSPARSRSRPPPRCLGAATSVPSARRGDAAPPAAPGCMTPGPRPPVRGARAPWSPDAAVSGARGRRRPRLGGGVAALSRERCIPSQDPRPAALPPDAPAPLAFPRIEPTRWLSASLLCSQHLLLWLSPLFTF